MTTFGRRDYEDDDYTGETFPPATAAELAELDAWITRHTTPEEPRMTFTADQLDAMAAAVTGRCEYTERTNAWRYNFGDTARRERSTRQLVEVAAHAAGVFPEDLTVEQVIVVAAVVDAAVAVYDERNRVNA